MNLEMKKDGDRTLAVEIEGSIDTVTAPQLEKALKDCYAEIEELVLDFSRVDYVSSAGLRVILSASEAMAEPKKLILKNVKEDVREVFEMTGFDELLTIE